MIPARLSLSLADFPRDFLRRMPNILILILCLAFCGCQWPGAMLEGNAIAGVTIRYDDIDKILSVTEQGMQASGYVRTVGQVPETEMFTTVRSGTPEERILTFIHGGEDKVWIIAQPIGSGWSLTCLPEPVGLHWPDSRIALAARCRMRESTKPRSARKDIGRRQFRSLWTCKYAIAPARSSSLRSR